MYILSRNLVYCIIGSKWRKERSRMYGLEVKESPKLFSVHPLRNMNVWTKLRGNPYLPHSGAMRAANGVNKVAGIHPLETMHV